MTLGECEPVAVLSRQSRSLYVTARLEILQQLSTARGQQVANTTQALRSDVRSDTCCRVFAGGTAAANVDQVGHLMTETTKA